MTNGNASTNSVQKHVRGSSFLLAGRMVSIVVNFLVQVLTVRYLSKSDYGVLAYGLSMASLGASIAVFGLDKTVTRFIPIFEERKEYGKVIGTLVLMISTILSIGFFLVLILYGFQSFIVSNLVNDELAFSLLLILVFLAPINALDSLLVGVFAIFADPKTIFFRRYVIGPGLKLSVILIAILFKSDVYFMARGYLAAGLFGVGFYLVLLVQLFSQLSYIKNFKWSDLAIPVKEIFSFSIPLLTSDVVFLMRHSLVVFMLEYFGSVTDVAAFRAVLPVARINLVVFQSFTFLYMPLASRMFANQDKQGINDLYWQSAAWISLTSLPIFLVTGSLAGPTTVLLFGSEYQDSGIIMALLAVGYYVNAVFGLNAITLRVWGKVKYIVTIDFVAVLISLILNLLLIPRYGALGGAISTCGTLLIHNMLNHAGLQFGTNVNLFQKKYVKIYASIILGAVAVAIIQQVFAPSLVLGILFVTIVSIIILALNLEILRVAETFPELMKFKVVRQFYKLLKLVPQTLTADH